MNTDTHTDKKNPCSSVCIYGLFSCSVCKIVVVTVLMLMHLCVGRYAIKQAVYLRQTDPPLHLALCILIKQPLGKAR